MIEYFGLSDAGNVRQNNEDYYLMAPSLGLYLVADGMGGAQAGEHASQLAAETVGEIVYKAGEYEPSLLVRAFEEANRRVFDAASNDSNLEGMGTTLVACLEAGEQCFVASVGDSRLYIWDEGKLASLTEDQTWVQEVGRRLGIEEAQLKVHPMRHVLTMAIGVSEQLRIHTYTIPRKEGLEILLSSDGLHGVVSDSDIAASMGKFDSLEEKGKALIQSAKTNGAPDNVTVVLLRVKDAAPIPVPAE